MKKVNTGRITADGFIDFDGPVSKFMRAQHPLRWRDKGGHKGGPHVLGKDADEWALKIIWATNTEMALMNVIEQLKENYDEAQKLWSGYDVKLTEFRGAVKNDVKSLEAAARKTTEAVQKMQTAYGDVINTLNSPEMKNATENAERLAAAMSALANLQSHKLSIAVVDNAPANSDQ